MNEDVIPIVHQWINGRDAEGAIKYGQPLRTFDGRNTDTDAIEEALDLVNYLVKRRMEREEVANVLLEASDRLANALHELGKMTDPLAKENDPGWEFIGKCHAIVYKLRADVPRIGVPATRQEVREVEWGSREKAREAYRHLSGGPMERLEDMEKS